MLNNVLKDEEAKRDVVLHKDTNTMDRMSSVEVLRNIGTKRTLLLMIRRQIFWKRMRKVSLKNLILTGQACGI